MGRKFSNENSVREMSAKKKIGTVLLNSLIHRSDTRKLLETNGLEKSVRRFWKLAILTILSYSNKIRHRSLEDTTWRSGWNFISNRDDFEIFDPSKSFISNKDAFRIFKIILNQLISHMVCCIRYATYSFLHTVCKIETIPRSYDFKTIRRDGRPARRFMSPQSWPECWPLNSTFKMSYLFEDFCRFSPLIIEISDKSVVISNKYRGLTLVSIGIFKFCTNQAFLLHHAVLDFLTPIGRTTFLRCPNKIATWSFSKLVHRRSKNLQNIRLNVFWRNNMYYSTKISSNSTMKTLFNPYTIFSTH